MTPGPDGPLRFEALARVFVWHVFPTAWLPGFAAMPLMFFVAGTMLPAPPGVGRPRWGCT